MIDPRDSPTVSFSPLIRIDNRLVHGQILEAWIPFISASHIVVVNDDVADDPFRESIIKMAVPREIEIRIYNIEEFARNITCENYTEKGDRFVLQYRRSDAGIQVWFQIQQLEYRQCL